MELAGGGTAARIDFAAFLQSGLCETDRRPADHAQRKGRLGVVDPLEFEKAGRIQLFRGEAADEINDFGGFFTLAPDPAPQPGDALKSGKAHLRRAGSLAIRPPSPPLHRFSG